ncbi:MAG: DUF3375 domain-containing protein, partial [Polyangiaceae bacterium]|nr:DUF3375 domain-containing protein [Polyangiaceae bacterium]
FDSRQIRTTSALYSALNWRRFFVGSLDILGRAILPHPSCPRNRGRVIRGIEQRALGLRGRVPEGLVTEIDAPSPELGLPLERPLFTPLREVCLSSDGLIAGEQDFTSDALFEQIYVDKALLRSHINRALQTRSQVSLAELVQATPLEHGLAELVAYMSLAVDDRRAMIDENRSEAVAWTDSEQTLRRATMPLVIFTR